MYRGERPVMRNLRVLVPIALAALCLTACNPDNTDSSNTAPSNSDSAQTPAPKAKLPNVNVDGNWHKSGDVCSLINADTASKALGYSGELTAEYHPDQRPAINGLDYCHYTDDPNFVLLNVAVVDHMTSSLWDRTVGEDVGGGKKGYNPRIQGVDKSYVNSVGQVLVLKGDVMISVLNNTLHDRVTSAQAANLAATVAKLF